MSVGMRRMGEACFVIVRWSEDLWWLVVDGRESSARFLEGGHYCTFLYGTQHAGRRLIDDETRLPHPPHPHAPPPPHQRRRHPTDERPKRRRRCGPHHPLQTHPRRRPPRQHPHYRTLITPHPTPVHHHHHHPTPHHHHPTPHHHDYP